jgi:hypothetical protein
LAKTKVDEKDLLRLPKPSKLEQIREIITEDEDYRFGQIKIQTKRPQYELPAPNREDPDNIELEKSFRCVVLLARPNYYQSAEDKEKGKDPVEKRLLYLLRTDKLMPERFYVSNSALRNWKQFAKDLVDSDRAYYTVVAEVTAEKAHSNKSGYTWSKPVFKIVRTLTDEELAHVETMRELVAGRVKEFEADSELDKFEAKALAVDRGGSDDDDDDDVERTHAKRTRAAVEDDDEPKKKSKKSKVDDDDEDEPKSKKSKKSKVDDDDEDEDDEPKKKSKKSKVDDDEDEDDEPKSKKSKGRSGYPDLDDDDDE